jgi:DNA helicase-2/ATP-dependent DNA helicase PcrA
MSNEFGKGPGEFRVVGPPGTGKTQAASEIAADSAKEYGFDKVMITSFSRSAAATIADRADIPEENVGTLHHFGNGLLEKGVKLYDKSPDFLKKFNAANPLCAVTSDKEDGEEDILAKRDMLLGKLTPQSLWPTHVARFHEAWEAAKAEANVVDFQDMIEAAYNSDYAPGSPSVIIVDEAQDFSKQQVEIVRKWGLKAEQVYFIGDDDQVLYHWRGASSEAMMNPKLEDWRYRFLAQSYRVPRQVHAAAMPWIERINPEHRLHKDYKPRDFEGAASCVGRGRDECNYKNPRRLVEDAMDHISEGRDVMFIASCRNMLFPLIDVLRRNGIPYANKYVMNSVEDRGWNPLRNDTILMKGVLAFLCGVSHPRGFPDPKGWNVSNLRALAKCLKDKGVDNWEKNLVDENGKDLPDDAVVTERTLQLVFSNKKLNQLFAQLEAKTRGEVGPLHFFEENLAAAYWDKPKKSLSDTTIGRFEYIEKVIQRRKAQALIDPPKVTVGTIHSVKGGEADVVYVFPDLSKPQMEDWRCWNGVGDVGHDSLIRLFYVAMTRAKQQLVVADYDVKSWEKVDLWKYMDTWNG